MNTKPADCRVPGHIQSDMEEEYFCHKCRLTVDRDLFMRLREACPDTALKLEVDDLLEAEERINAAWFGQEARK